MAETAIDRTKRALDLIPYVLERPGISIQDLAKDFAVSEKQIRADLDLLFVCGLPGYSPLELIDISTDDDFVDVLEPQLLDHPRNLTRREVVALVIALEALAASRNSSDPLRTMITQLQRKLQSILDAPVSKPEVVNTEADPHGVLTAIEKALSLNCELEVEYLSAKSDSRTVRRIAPSRIYMQNGSGYLQAWCYNSEGERTFRIDRIVRADLQENPQSSENHVGSGREVAQSIIVSIRAGAREFVERHQGICTVVSVTGEETILRVDVEDTNWLLRTLIGYGSAARIEEPAEIATQLSVMAHEALALYTR